MIEEQQTNLALESSPAMVLPQCVYLDAVQLATPLSYEKAALKNTQPDILARIHHVTEQYISEIPKAQRKKYGQFFTSQETALFMAKLFVIDRKITELSVLDAGAGSGILSAALITILQNQSHIKRIKLTCYETDQNILPLLENNLSLIRELSTIPLSYELITENYITSQETEFNEWLGANQNPTKYDLIIGNPPYMKQAKTATEAKAMERICYGAPNLYFLFAAMGVFNLKRDAEMVYIIPRSWTSGAYFKKFRQYIFANTHLLHIHLFENRKKVFDSEDVLQETMIIKLKKSKSKASHITVTSTQSNKDFSSINHYQAPYDSLVTGKEQYVYLATNKEEARLLEKLNKWSDTLPSLGLRMKTGLTVHFRSKDVLRDCEEDANVPVFYAQHMKGGQIDFPIGKEKEYMQPARSGLLQKNQNYLFVKRFTSKEESRRLQSAIYLADYFSRFNYISTDNKINFIEGNTPLSKELIYGLYVIFNSSIYDRYYRILNGSTQVNSTEVNSMPMPCLEIIHSMGEKLLAADDFSTTGCDKIIEKYL